MLLNTALRAHLGCLEVLLPDFCALLEVVHPVSAIAFFQLLPQHLCIVYGQRGEQIPRIASKRPTVGQGGLTRTRPSLIKCCPSK